MHIAHLDNIETMNKSLGDDAIIIIVASSTSDLFIVSILSRCAICIYFCLKLVIDLSNYVGEHEIVQYW